MQTGQGNCFKNILLKTNFTRTFQNAPILYCSFFICLHLFQHPLVIPSPSALPRFILNHFNFNEGSFVDFSKILIKHLDIFTTKTD